jgi:hypothetical protein
MHFLDNSFDLLAAQIRLRKFLLQTSLTNFFDLSNIRAFAGGPEKNVWGLAMFWDTAFPIRWATGAESRFALVV